jgi:hypothetical protein
MEKLEVKWTTTTENGMFPGIITVKWRLSFKLID